MPTRIVWCQSLLADQLTPIKLEVNLVFISKLIVFIRVDLPLIVLGLICFYPL